MFHKRLIKEFRENQKNIWGMVLTQWVMLIANVVLMLQTATFIAGMVRGENLQNQSIRLLVTLAVVVVVRSLMSPLNSKLSFEASKQVKARLRTMVYEKMMRLGSSYKEYFQTSEVVQITTEGVEQLEIYFGKYMPQFFYSMLAPVTLFVIVGTMSLKVAVVLLICVPLIPLSIVAVQKFAKKMLAKYWGTYTEMGDSFLECLQGLTTLKIYQADERYAKRMDEEAEKFRKVTMRVLIMQLNSISIMDLVAYGGAAVGIILSILEYQKGVIGLAQCFFIIMISAEFFLPLRLLGSFFHIAMNGNAAADKIFRLVDLEEDQGEKSAEMEGESDEIAFSNVSFSYEAKKKVLEGISFRAGHGLTALVGESGCGKSTTTLLLMGDRRADEGQIFIGDMPIDKMDLKALRRKITRIRHDSYLFAGTILENIRYGKPDASREEVIRAAKEANAHEFIMNFPDGYDTDIGQRGVKLSGGQKQRLSIARVFLKNPPILIFDEATSALDNESEKVVQESLEILAKGRTTFVIAHRLSTIRNAQRILVLTENGIEESGTHAELLAKGGIYQKLCEMSNLS